MGSSSFVTTANLTETTLSGIFYDVKPLSQWGRIVVTCCGALMSAIALYISVSLLVHRIKSENAIKENPRQPLRRKLNLKSSNWMNNLSLAASLLAFTSTLIDHSLLYVSDVSSVSCKLLQLFSHIFYSTGHSCVYLFLWFRQRTCYRNPSLAILHNKFCRVASAGILPVFLIMTATGLVLTGFIWNFESSSIGCIETTKKRTPLIGLFLASLAMQTTLLLLFLYPLKSHKVFLAKRQVLSSADSVLVKLIKRSIFSTFLCIMADGLAFALGMALDRHLPFIVTNYIYDSNLIFNVIFMMASFADWKYRIAPWCYSEELRKSRQLTGSFASTVRVTTLKTERGQNSIV